MPNHATIPLAALAVALAAPPCCASVYGQDSATAANPMPAAVTPTTSSPAVFLVTGEYTIEGPDATLRRELLCRYLQTRGQPFVAAIPSATSSTEVSAAAPASDADGLPAGSSRSFEALDAEIRAAFLAIPSLLEDRSVRLTLGPLVIRPGQPTPGRWWSTQVEFTAAEIVEATDRLDGREGNADEHTNGAAASHQPNLLLLVGSAPTLAALGRVHHESVAGLLGCSTIATRDTAPTTNTVPPPASVQPAGQHPFVPYLGTSSALELVAWIQALDAKQCALRAEGVDRLKDADAIVADIRAVLRALEAHELRRLLEERVPPSAPSGASLCASPSWPNDAWELVAAVERGRRNAARIRSELLRLAAAVAAEQRLPPEVLARLEERLEVIAAKLPLNLQWNQRLAEELRERVGDVMDPSGGAQSARTQLALAGNADGALNIGGAVIDGMTGPDDIVGGRMAANRAAWDVYGYLWSGKDALLPSEHAQRELQREAALSEFNAVAAQHGTPPAVAKMLANDLADSLSDPWRPWMQFPMSNEVLKERVLPSIRESVAWSLDALRSNEFNVTGEWKVLFWWGVADSSFALEPNRNMVRHRNQPFADCRPYYINGVGLASRR